MTPETEEALKTVTLVTAERVNRIIFAIAMAAAFFSAGPICDLLLG